MRCGHVAVLTGAGRARKPGSTRSPSTACVTTYEGTRRRREQSSGPQRGPAGRLAQASRQWRLRDEIGRALMALSDEEREAVALRFGADLTLPEIAKLTGHRLTTIEGRVYRALRKMRNRMHGAESAGIP